MLSEVRDVLRLLTERLQHMGAVYFIGGSVATAVLGSPRMTRDIDIVVVLHQGNVNTFATTMEPEFFVDVDLAYAAIHSAETEDAAFNILHLPTMFKVDVFIHRSSEWQNNALQRRQEVVFGEEPETFSVYIASPEDMILQKLRWYRLTGERSDRQWNDVQGVLLEQTEIDLDYLRRFSEEAGVTDLLERALQEAR
jgi:hypothetical protein